VARTRFNSVLQDRILAAINEVSASLSSGVANDYPHYRDIVGYIRGLSDALKLCDEVEEDFDR
jgi:hypothetical protein